MGLYVMNVIKKTTTNKQAKKKQTIKLLAIVKSKQHFKVPFIGKSYKDLQKYTGIKSSTKRHRKKKGWGGVIKLLLLLQLKPLYLANTACYTWLKSMKKHFF